MGVLLLLLGVVPVAGGCSDCQTSCGGDEELVRFTAELSRLDGTVATFGRDGDVTTVDVVENAGFLDVGRTYRVAGFPDPTDATDITSAVNSDCRCWSQISHADGTPIDTGWRALLWREWPIREVLAVVIGVPVLTIVAVVVRRIVRGPDDPYRDLPDDGEWVEFDSDSF